MDILQTCELYKKVSDKFSLKNINLNIESGDFLALIGKNGAGKTTLLRIISGLLRYDTGKVLIDGIPVEKSSKVNKLIGIVQQSKGLPDSLTVQEYVRFQGRLRNADIKVLNGLIEISGLTEYYNQYLSTLSGGNLRKLHIMLSIMHKPKLVIMDEPTVGLDPIVRRDIWKYIYSLKELGISAIISTHYIDEAEILSDKIAIIDNGSIVTSGTKDEIKKLYNEENGLEVTLIDNNEALSFLNEIAKLNIDFIKSANVFNDKVKIITNGYDCSYLLLISKFLAEGAYKVKMIKLLDLSIEDVLVKIISPKALLSDI
ncbi:ABC transporter ATP-binding protein [Alkaliphilus peptidifermentans]|uniref:ABC-2 type transport system ATP-binding protein n=1 Tax=Alkaliphilus peptidifermentans DSM 18978 TaxID=1120976 RepID=A0A1G5K7R6_9FIRM|nr:ABC transporter ATP-binding protein [Alkaliphilus peptidifermentans]SCY96301.1 ABC-2 type transport system ATP-binding protein [Alkaliphilus peptidifermentans DSM 18978]